MPSQRSKLQNLIKRAQTLAPIRLSVVVAEQQSVLTSIKDAVSLGLIKPHLIGDPTAIRACAQIAGLAIDQIPVTAAKTEAEAARIGIEMIRNGVSDVAMKGHLHTDTFMHALLDSDRGLRVPGRRVSHVFIVDIPTYPKLLAITDAAINISPDLNAKAQILENAIELLKLLDVKKPKVAVLSAVETINPEIISTIDAAALSIMAKRGQIAGAIVDGPMGFDNAISAEAAREKGIISEVAGDVDILLVPDLVSGNILAKNLVYLADSIAAGLVVGLSAPVVLSSRSDSPTARLAALALAVLMHGSVSSNTDKQQGRLSRSPPSTVLPNPTSTVVRTQPESQ